VAPVVPRDVDHDVGRAELPGGLVRDRALDEVRRGAVRRCEENTAEVPCEELAGWGCLHGSEHVPAEW